MRTDDATRMPVHGARLHLRRAVRLASAALVALSLAGCATLPADPSKMTAEQLRETVKDKSATLGCATVQTPYKGNTIFLNLDKGVLNVGEVTVGSDCTVTIKNAPK